MGSAGARKTVKNFILVPFSDCQCAPAGSLSHSGHRETAVAGAPWAARENPSAGHRVTTDAAGESECVPTGRSRQDAHAELAGDVAAEISGEREAATLGFVGNEAGRVAGEMEVVDGHSPAIAGGLQRC